MIVTTMTKSIKFDGENLIVNLKDTFKALQNVKKTAKNDLRNDYLRTPENPIKTTKKDVLKTSFVNGAGNGLILEPCRLLHVIAKNHECQEIIDNLLKYVA